MKKITILFLVLVLLSSSLVHGEGLIQQVKENQEALKRIEEKLSAIMFQSGDIQLRAVNTRPLLDDAACSPGTGNDRGIVNGRQEFERPFKEIPKVVIALKELDVSGGPSKVIQSKETKTVSKVQPDTIRINLEVTEVDTKGFNYNFNTWCRTKVYSAQAVWFAVSQ